MSTQHASDCAVHNMPAYPNGPCDCGAIEHPDYITLLGRLELADLFWGCRLVEPAQVNMFRQYFLPAGEYFISGLPGFVAWNSHTGRCKVMTTHVATPYVGRIQERLFGGVIGEFEIVRSHRNPSPETMLVVAHSTHRMNKVDVALVPHLTDEDVARKFSHDA